MIEYWKTNVPGYVISKKKREWKKASFMLKKWGKWKRIAAMKAQGKSENINKMKFGSMGKWESII